MKVKGSAASYLLVTWVMWAVSAGVAWAGPSEFSPPGEKARCVVCGMFVEPYPAWVAEVVLEGAAPYYFDGPKDLFRYLEERDKYHPGEKVPPVAAIFVTEYYTQQHLAAEEVFFVAGSDVLGPMGHELVPVAGEQSLQTFLQDHGGNKVMVYRDMKLTEVMN